jgi:Mce-associated membrane protein
MGMVTAKRQGRAGVSGAVVPVGVDDDSEPPGALPDDAGCAGGARGDESGVIGSGSRNALCGDGPELTASDAEETEPAGEVIEHTATNPVKRLRLVWVASVLIVAVLGGLVGYLGYRGYQMQVAARQREVFLSVGRQAAIDLTTISYTEAEADVARILDSATGTFHDDFQQRSQPFIDVVKRAQSTSQGSVTAAGLASLDGDRAQVIVALSVKTANAGVPEQQPRGWRMRLDVERVGDTAKVSDVQFVP